MAVLVGPAHCWTLYLINPHVTKNTKRRVSNFRTRAHRQEGHYRNSISWYKTAHGIEVGKRDTFENGLSIDKKIGVE